MPSFAFGAFAGKSICGETSSNNFRSCNSFPRDVRQRCDCPRKSSRVTDEHTWKSSGRADLFATVAAAQDTPLGRRSSHDISRRVLPCYSDQHHPVGETEGIVPKRASRGGSPSSPPWFRSPSFSNAVHVSKGSISTLAIFSATAKFSLSGKLGQAPFGGQAAVNECCFKSSCEADMDHIIYWKSILTCIAQMLFWIQEPQRVSWAGAFASS